MFVNWSAVLNILGEVFTPRLWSWFGFSAAIGCWCCCYLGGFDELQSLREIKSRHTVLLEPEMQYTYVVEIKLGVHLFALLIDLVLLWVGFLRVVATSMWTNHITHFFLRDIQGLNCFEVVASCVFKHGFCMAQETHLLLASHFL